MEKKICLHGDNIACVSRKLSQLQLLVSLLWFHFWPSEPSDIQQTSSLTSQRGHVPLMVELGPQWDLDRQQAMPDSWSDMAELMLSSRSMR